MTAAELIAQLSLEPHPLEGGYFRRIYETQASISTDHGPRLLASSIHYLLVPSHKIGYLHRNRSDILHFYQLGNPVRYHLLFADGIYQQVTLGPEVGQQLQLTVPGGVWKASELMGEDYGLISEVVVPGFDYADNQLARAADLDSFPKVYQPQLAKFIAPDPSRPQRG